MFFFKPSKTKRFILTECNHYSLNDLIVSNEYLGIHCRIQIILRPQPLFSVAGHSYGPVCLGVEPSVSPHLN